MLDTILGLLLLLSPVPVALDLRRTDRLSAETPIDVRIELVVIRERPRTQRTLAHSGGGGGGGGDSGRRFFFFWWRFRTETGSDRVRDLPF